MGKDFSTKVRISAIDKITAPMDKITGAFPKLDKAIRKSSQAMRIFDKETEKLKRDFDAVGGKLKSIGGAMTVGVTLPVVGGTALAINAFREYETALIGVGKTTNLEGPALDQLGTRFLAMSKTIPLSVNELLALGQSAAQLGVKGNDNILKFTETMAKLSKASNVVGEEGAAQMARLINATKGSMGDVDRLASSIVYLGNNFAVTEAEVLEFGTRLGSSTSIFNVSAQNALGIATALKSVGINAELGSSAVQRGFMGINEAIGKGGKHLQALSVVTGIASGDLKEAFEKDSVAVFQKFTEGLGRLGKEGKDITKILKVFGLTGVGNTQVLGTLATKTEILDQALKGANQAFKDNLALDKEFSSFLKSMDSQIALAKNRFMELAITLGQQLKPVILFTLETFTKIAQFLIDNPMFTNIAIAIAGVTAVIGPMLLAFGTFLTMLPSLVAGWVALKVAMVAFGGTVAAAFLPVTAAILAFVAAYKLGEAIMNKFGGGGGVGEWLAGKMEGDVEAQGAESVQAGIAKRRGGLEAASKINSEFIQRTNNARVDINVRAPKSTSVVGESENGMMSINRGQAGAF